MCRARKSGIRIKSIVDWNNMKTAGEWLISDRDFFDMTTFEDHEVLHLIKQIQLDAWKQGMEDRAIIERLLENASSDYSAGIVEEMLVNEKQKERFDY